MRRWKVLAVVALVALSSASLGMASLGKRTSPKKSKAKAKRVLHVVAFKFKEEATKEQIDKVCRDFRTLKKKIPEILSYKAGVNNSPEKLNKGFKHCFILSFKDVKARDAYLIHPAHKEFGESLGGLIADVFVVDFET
ncbi:Dabb family protein [bacterium]|nr:Dabb family protein [bacterium]